MNEKMVESYKHQPGSRSTSTDGTRRDTSIYTKAAEKMAYADVERSILLTSLWNKRARPIRTDTAWTKIREALAKLRQATIRDLLHPTIGLTYKYETVTQAVAGARHRGEVAIIGHRRIGNSNSPIYELITGADTTVNK